MTLSGDGGNGRHLHNPAQLSHIPLNIGAGCTVEEQDSSLNEQPVEYVTQAQLQRLIQLKGIANEYNELRSQIRQAILAGASVEPGMIGAAIRQSESRQLSAAKLRNLLGDDQAEEILNRVMPTTTSQLVIREELSQI